MKKNTNKQDTTEDIRHDVIGRSHTSSPADHAFTEAGAIQQLHARHLRQVALEVENAELRQTRTKIEASLALYTDLYDFAPIGYFTLNRDGVILEVNLRGASFLGVERCLLVDQGLCNFVALESRPIFHAFLKKVFSATIKEVRELRFINKTGRSFFVHIEATADESRQVCRLVMLDIHERRMAEETLRHSREMLHDLISHQERVKEDERKRIAREIHDELGQNLLALRIDISMLHSRTKTTHPHLNKKVQTALNHIDTTMKSMRAIINNLRPSVLDLGLNAAIEWQVQDFQRRTGIASELVLDETDFALDDSRATAVFRILQESLSNVIRHAQASQVHIELHKKSERVFMTVSDNGIGIFPDCRRKTNSFGLLGITERVSKLGGEITIDTGKGSGTTLSISIPVETIA